MIPNPILEVILTVRRQRCSVTFVRVRGRIEHTGYSMASLVRLMMLMPLPGNDNGCDTYYEIRPGYYAGKHIMEHLGG